MGLVKQNAHLVLELSEMKLKQMDINVTKKKKREKKPRNPLLRKLDDEFLSGVLNTQSCSTGKNLDN